MFLDARGLSCPMPLLKLKQALHAMPPGALLQVVTSDPVSQRDFQVFLRQAGHELLQMDAAGDEFHFEIRKKS